MKEIKEDTEIIDFDGVTCSKVYVGGLSDLQPADNLKWRNADEETCLILGIDAHVIKLSEIVEQLRDARIITVIIESPTYGEIWQYGNYGKGWFVNGELKGYA